MWLTHFSMLSWLTHLANWPHAWPVWIDNFYSPEISSLNNLWSPVFTYTVSLLSYVHPVTQMNVHKWLWWCCSLPSQWLKWLIPRQVQWLYKQVMIRHTSSWICNHTYTSHFHKTFQGYAYFEVYRVVVVQKGPGNSQ